MIRFGLLLLCSLLVVALRRLLRGRARPSWTLAQEALVRALRVQGTQLLRCPIAEARARLERVAARGPAGARVEHERLDGLPATRVVPPAALERALLLYLHGGGYALGSARSYRDLLARLALQSGVTVVAVDYRRAPEARFPAALDDCCAAYAALLARSPAGTRIAVAGDSAGGALAVALALRAREAGLPPPRCAVLLSPWVDLSSASPSVVSNAAFDWGDREYLQHWARLYLEDADPRHPLASPLYAELRGLPPLQVHVGDAELLHDEVCAFAARARAQGVEVELRVWPDMVHGWWLAPPVFPQAAETLAQAARFVVPALGADADAAATARHLGAEDGRH